MLLHHPGWLLGGLALATGLAGLALCRRRGWKWTTAATTAVALAFSSGGIYYLLMAPASAQAGIGDYTEGETLFYTLDHIGRPFNLRNSDLRLRWFEHHYPFGDTIKEKTVGSQPIYAGAGNYAITWKPDFKFPGQYAEVDQYPFVQNHFREYLPEYGIYSRIDPFDELLMGNRCFRGAARLPPYTYANNRPLYYTDAMGLSSCNECCSTASACVYADCMWTGKSYGLGLVSALAAFGGKYGAAANGWVLPFLPTAAEAMTAIGLSLAISVSITASYCGMNALEAGIGCKIGCNECTGCEANDLCEFEPSWY